MLAMVGVALLGSTVGVDAGRPRRTPADEVRHPWPPIRHDAHSPALHRKVNGIDPLPRWHGAITPPAVLHVTLLRLPDHPLFPPRESWAWITLQHEDLVCGHRLDGVEVRDDRGRVVVRLAVEHGHPAGLGGEPFTVLAQRLFIPADARSVTFRAHDGADGLGARAVTIDLGRTEGEGYRVIPHDPYPLTGRPMAARRYLRSRLAAEMVNSSW